MSALAAVWTFLRSGAGRVIAGLVAVGAVIAGAWASGHHRGAQAQAKADAADTAATATQAAQTTQATVADASAAANAVVTQAQAQPAPDVAKRNDFDNTF